tara:strand:+ start:254 stop:475 length:222 start_codon:yes stop_codon:yes gene_type:complete
MKIDRIEGTIYLKDDETSQGFTLMTIQFHLDDQTWEQFGATRNQLVQAGTSELMERLQKVLAQYMHEVDYEQA